MTPRLFAQHEAEAGVGRGDVRREDGARLPGFDAEPSQTNTQVKAGAVAEPDAELPDLHASEAIERLKRDLTVLGLTERVGLMLAGIGGGPVRSGVGASLQKMTFGMVQPSSNMARRRCGKIVAGCWQGMRLEPSPLLPPACTSRPMVFLNTTNQCAP